MKKIVILGAGTGGTILAHTLPKKLSPKEWEITIIDKACVHMYQPGFIFLPFRLYGYENRNDIVRPIDSQIPADVKLVQADVKFIDYESKKVKTTEGQFDYDWLILAMGCHIEPKEIEGLAEALDGEKAYTFYTLESSLNFQESLAKMEKGKFVVHIAEMPIKCPVAPIEFVFLADYYFHKRGIRDKIEIEFVTPLSGAFTKPLATKMLDDLAKQKNIKIIPNFDVESIDPEKRTISSYGGKTVEYDMLASVPPNVGPDVIEESGLGDGIGYAITDNHTLKHKKVDNVYVLGDNTNVPTSKAGSVTHFEAEIIEENLIREINGQEPLPDFDGHSNCFIESGFHKALLIDFNYETEPLPGVFPVPKAGPFSLLKESRLNHWGKMAFKHIYWNLLLSGRLPSDPLLPAQMSFTGKEIPMDESDSVHG